MTTQIKERFLIQNTIESKVRRASSPVTITWLLSCPDLHGSSYASIRSSLEGLRKKGAIIRVPYSDPLGSRDRYGYQWSQEIPKIQADPKGIIEDDLKIKVNDDSSITIVTNKIRITIEVPR